MHPKQSPTRSYAQIGALGRICDVRHDATRTRENVIAESHVAACDAALPLEPTSPQQQHPSQSSTSTPRVIAEKYRLIDLLGRGGMGSVWRAEHLTLNSPVAVKLLEPSVASDPLALARFMREARAAAKLRSPHVVQILDHGVDQGIPYIVMELLEGESLAARLARQGRLNLKETVLIVSHIARALSRAHTAGIIHRDLKPDNVFLVKDDDEQELAKLLDFGIAKSEHGALETRSEQSTGPGILVGTPFYASPEQAQGAKVLDHRSDIWALGVIAFECLLGERPFRGDSLGDVLLGICVQPLPIPSRRGSVPKGFDAWFKKACARSREQRFDSAKLAASELAKLCEAPLGETPDVAHEPEPAHELPLRTTVREPRPAHATRTAFASVACAIVLALAMLAYLSRLRPPVSEQHAASPAKDGGAFAVTEPSITRGTALVDVGAEPKAPRADAGPPTPEAMPAVTVAERTKISVPTALRHGALRPVRRASKPKLHEAAALPKVETPPETSPAPASEPVLPDAATDEIVDFGI
jgi:serine/threonine-protein kinase